MGYDFLNPEVFKKLETDCYNLARDGKMIDYSNFPAAEYRYFERLSGVYAKFSREEMTLEEAKAQKLVFYKDYKNDLAQYLKYSEVCKKYQDAIKATEQLCSELCKMVIKFPDDVNAALRKALEIVSAARGEDVTEKTVLRNMEGAGQ